MSRSLNFEHMSRHAHAHMYFVRVLCGSWIFQRNVSETTRICPMNSKEFSNRININHKNFEPVLKFVTNNDRNSFVRSMNKIKYREKQEAHGP